MKNRSASRLVRSCLLLLSLSLSPLASARPPGGGELTNPFVCLEGAGAAPHESPRIVLVAAELYLQRDLIDARLRRVAEAPEGDVRVLVSGIPDDERCLDYKAWRLGTSLEGRVGGLEGVAVWSLAGQVAPLFALSGRINARGPLAELRREQYPSSAIKMQALRNLHLLPLVTRAWRSTLRPLVPCDDADPEHVAAIEELFDAIASSATDPESTVPAPDDPRFDEEVLAPLRAAFEDDLAFLLVLRAQVQELIAWCKEQPTGCEDVAPSYRPDLGRLREAVVDGIFRLDEVTGRPLRDILYDWRHYAAASRIAAEYCSLEPGRSLEVIVAAREAQSLKELLQRFVGSRVLVELRPIAD